MKIQRKALLAVVMAIVLPGHASAAGSSCQSLQKMMLENATVTLASMDARPEDGRR
jgi:hypothetical protein